MSQPITVDRKAWILLLLLSLVWGSSFILIKKALIVLHPVELACMRISISSLAFLPILLLNFKKVDLRKWPLFLVVGLAGSGIPAFLYAFAQQQVSSSMAGLLNSLTPIFTFILGILIFKDPFRFLKGVGVMVGFLGAALLVVMDKKAGFGGDLAAVLMIVFGTFCYGLSVNTVEHKLKGTGPLVISAASFFMIGPPAMIYLFSQGTIPSVLDRPEAWKSLGAIFILSLLGTVTASILFYGLVQRTSAVFGSTVAYLMPVMALVWGFVDGEAILYYHLIGLALILAGVYLIKKM